MLSALGHIGLYSVVSDRDVHNLTPLRKASHGMATLSVTSWGIGSNVMALVIPFVPDPRPRVE